MGQGQCFPCLHRHREASWALGPNPLPSEPPSCPAEPRPLPYTPTQGPMSTLGDPLQRAGPKPHPHTLTNSPTAKLGELHTPEDLLSTYCLSPSEQVLSRGPTPS